MALPRSEGRTLLLLGSSSNLSPLAELVKLETNSIVVALTASAQQCASSLNLAYKTPADYLTPEVSAHIARQALEWVDAWPRIPIKGKSFMEWVSYQETSLWWFLRRRVYRSAREIIQQVETLKAILAAERPTRVYLLGSHPSEHILPCMEGVEVTLVPAIEQDHGFNPVTCLRNHTSLLWSLYRVYELGKALLARILAKGSPRSGGRRIIVVTQNEDWQSLPHPGTGETAKGDTHFDSVLWDLKKEENIQIMTTDRLDSTVDRGWRSLPQGIRVAWEKRRLERRFIHRPFECYLTLDIDRRVSRERRQLSRLWASLKREPEFMNSLSYSGIPLRPFLEPDLNFCFGFTLGIIIKRIAMAQHMLDLEQPRLLVLGCECADFGRALVVGARSKGVPTLALQFGVYVDDDVDYIHRVEDVSPNGQLGLPFCPIPDRTVVYGFHYLGSLTRHGSYPPGAVTVTGQPRYDALILASQLFHRELTFQKLGLDGQRKLVLWASQISGSPSEEHERSFYAVYNAMKALGQEAYLVIKPHQNQKDTVMDEEIARKVGFQPLIVRTFNTQELIHACDVFITFSSTTGVEAIMLSKPVIILNLTGRPDPVAYVQRGVALGVSRDEDLLSALRSALYDPEVKAKLDSHRQSFLRDYAYGQDGKSTHRVADLIRQMVAL